MVEILLIRDAPESSATDPLNQRLADVLRQQLGLGLQNCAQLPCGTWWDAILTRDGDSAGDLLAWVGKHQFGGCGAVIADAEHDVLLWLVPPGTVREWLHPLALCFGAPAEIMVPPLRRRCPPGPYWAQPFTAGHLVDPDILREALSRYPPASPIPGWLPATLPVLPVAGA